MANYRSCVYGKGSCVYPDVLGCLTGYQNGCYIWEQANPPFKTEKLDSSKNSKDDGIEAIIEK